MKKILLLIILFIPFMVYAEDSCNPDSIKIEGISLVDKSENVVENNSPSSDGNIVNLDLKVSKLGDNAKYELLVKNTAKEDYELNKDSLTIGTDFVDYNIEIEDGSNIIKAGESKKVYLVVKYANEVPVDKFDESGLYNDNKNLVVDLTNKDIIKEINPYTGTGIILVIIAIVSGLVIISIKKVKVRKYMLLVIPIMLLIPCYVYAICKCELKIESKVVVEKLYTGTIYRNNNELVFNGESYLPHEKEVWSYKKKNSDLYFLEEKEINAFLTKEECELTFNDFKDSQQYECSKNKINVGLTSYKKENDYEVNSFYLKYSVVDNIVKKSEVCFKGEDSEICLTDNTVDNFYLNNKNKIVNYFGDRYCSIYDYPPVESINAYSCWFFVDSDNDGEDERYESVTVDNGTSYIGFSCGGLSCYIKHDGLSYCLEKQCYA
ncbi:MAG: hypothetical protein IKQ29_00095 [Bacilli bacterium]|nr:hypothetical protein [Bacilli bacterium]